jgi:lysozyme
MVGPPMGLEEISPELIGLLREHEGVRSRAYQDSLGNWTIGVGRNLQNPGLSRDEVIALTKEVDLPDDIINLLLQNDLQAVAHQVAGTVGDATWATLNEPRQAALIDMGFAGPAKLSYFYKLLAALQHGLWQSAHDEVLNSKWATQVGSSRANCVADMLLTGNWP